MAGASIFGPGFLILSNATVTVEAYAITQAAGGTVQTYSTIASGIEVLVTLFAGDRDGSFGSDAQRDVATLTGVDTSLNRTDTRIKITDFPDMPEFVNTYWRVTSPQHHPQSPGGLLASRITCSIQRVDFPIS